MSQVGIFNVRTGAQTKFFTEQIAQVSRRAPLENALLGRGERGESDWGGGVRQRAEQRFRVRCKKAFGLGPHGVPGREDQECVVVRILLHVGNARDGSGEAKDLLKVWNLRFRGARFFPARVPVFCLSKRKASGDDSRFLEQESVELGQLNASTRFVRIGRER